MNRFGYLLVLEKNRVFIDEEFWWRVKEDLDRPVSGREILLRFATSQYAYWRLLEAAKLVAWRHSTIRIGGRGSRRARRWKPTTQVTAWRPISTGRRYSEDEWDRHSARSSNRSASVATDEANV